MDAIVQVSLHHEIIGSHKVNLTLNDLRSPKFNAVDSIIESFIERGAEYISISACVVDNLDNSAKLVLYKKGNDIPNASKRIYEAVMSKLPKADGLI